MAGRATGLRCALLSSDDGDEGELSGAALGMRDNAQHIDVIRMPIETAEICEVRQASSSSRSNVRDTRANAEVR